MRGIFTSAILLAMLFPLSHLYGAHIFHQSRIGAVAAELYQLEKIRSGASEVRNAFAQVLHWEGMPGGQQERAAGRVLADLENALEEKLGREGIDAKLWFGACPSFEIAALKIKMLKSELALIGKGGFGFSRLTIDYHGRPAYLSTGFLFSNGKGLVISKKGLMALPEALALGYSLREICYAASMLVGKNTALVVEMGEGFE
ncbi:MAG: hypothetical protein ABH863_02975 [Candidatus Micrarchaeota archaeon]